MTCGAIHPECDGCDGDENADEDGGEGGANFPDPDSAW